MLMMKPMHAVVTVDLNHECSNAAVVKRMNTKSRSQYDSVMCQRFQKSLMSTARNGARKLRGTSMPSAKPRPTAICE